jgi:hypothetical protein
VCKHSGQLGSYSVKPSPRKPVTGIKYITNSHLQQAYFISLASGGKAKHWSCAYKVSEDFISLASGGKAKPSDGMSLGGLYFISLASGGKAKPSAKVVANYWQFYSPKKAKHNYFGNDFGRRF